MWLILATLIIFVDGAILFALLIHVHIEFNTRLTIEMNTQRTLVCSIFAVNDF